LIKFLKTFSIAKGKHFCPWQKQAYGLPTTLSVRSFQTFQNALRATRTLPVPARVLSAPLNRKKLAFEKRGKHFGISVFWENTLCTCLEILMYEYIIDTFLSKIVL
jgi:hypothetical protein